MGYTLTLGREDAKRHLLLTDKSGMRLTESLHQAVKARSEVRSLSSSEIGEALLQLCLRLTEESEEVG
jgi:hypothetical protein